MKKHPHPSAGKIVFFHWVFLVMFLVFGAGIVREGFKAIRDRQYTLEYTEGTSVGTQRWTEEKANEYSGRDATIFGIGFAAMGAMLLSWAAGLAVSLLGRAGLKAPRFVALAIGAVSMACVLVACVALFPPWKLRLLPLYLVAAAFTAAVTLPVPDRFRKNLFPAMVVLIVLFGMIGFPWFPIFMGFFVFLILLGNLAVFWPGLVKHIGRRKREDEEANPAVSKREETEEDNHGSHG